MKNDLQPKSSFNPKAIILNPIKTHIPIIKIHKFFSANKRIVFFYYKKINTWKLHLTNYANYGNIKTINVELLKCLNNPSQDMITITLLVSPTLKNKEKNGLMKSSMEKSNLWILSKLWKRNTLNIYFTQKKFIASQEKQITKSSSNHMAKTIHPSNITKMQPKIIFNLTSLTFKCTVNKKQINKNKQWNMLIT